MAVPDAASIFKQAIEEEREKFMRMTHLQTTNKMNQKATDFQESVLVNRIFATNLNGQKETV